MSLKIGEVDYSKEIVKPQLSLCKPTREVIDVLSTSYDIVFDQLLGALNELTFRLPVFVEKHHMMVRNESIDIIKGRYIILFELGNYKEYFVINQIDRVGGNDEYLDVKCLSLAYEMNDKIIRGYEVVSYTCSSILNDLLSDTIWKVKYVDSEFDLSYRSFEVSSSTVLEAVIELAKTFNALMLYDTVNRTVSFYNPSNIGEDKGFSVSYGKYLEGVNQEDNSEEIITRLRMFGKEGISIQTVIPSGQEYIEDFNYFLYPYEEHVEEIKETVSPQNMLSNWNKLGYSSNFSQSANGLMIQSSNGYSRIVNTSENLKNFNVIFNVKNNIGNIGSNFGFIFGYVDSNNYYQFVYERSNSDLSPDSLKLYKYSNGYSTLLSSQSRVQRWSPNIEYVVQVEVLNNIFSLKIDNVLAMDYIDESYVGGGYGFSVLNNSTLFSNVDRNIINWTVLNHSEYMTDELCYYIKRYERLLKDGEGVFNDLVSYRTAYNEQLNLLDDELQALNDEHKQLLDERDILNTRIARNEDEIDRADNIEQPTEYWEDGKATLISQRDAKNIEIDNKVVELNLKKDEIAVVQSRFDGILHKIDLYRVGISLENNFPKKLYDERNQFVIEKEWTDTNIIEPEALLKEGLKVFDEYRQQKITVTVDVVNFLAMIDEQINWDKLNEGDNFYIDHERLGFVYQAKITGINYQFEGSGGISLTISNVKDVYSNKSKFLELLYKANQISSSVSMKEWEWDLSLENRGSINEIINNIWDANRQAIIGAKDQVVEISDRGLIIRDENDPMKYLVAINGMLALTNDGGRTFKHAITTEGIVGERIYGKIIMGVNLAIEDESGILTIQGSRGKIFNRDGLLRMHFGLVEENGLCGESFGLIAENEITQVKVTDCEGFVINRKNPNEQDYPTGWEKVFWTTTDGTIFAHDLVVSDIKVVQNKEWNSLIMDSELGFFDLGFFSKIVKDGKLTTDEKLQLITEMMQISSSYMSILKQADKYMYVSRDDEIDFTRAFNTSIADFPRTESQEAKMDLQPLKNAYLELVNFMSQYIKIISSNPHEPLEIEVEDEMTETTSDLGENREKLILLFKKYYDEYDKLSDDIENIIVYQGISMGENYNNTFIGEHGVVVVRNDGMYRAYLNATNGLALEKWENGAWVKKLYGAINDPDWEDGTLIAEGLVTKNLRIVDAHMNEKITFDWYDGITIFGDSNTIYLNANDSIKIEDLDGDKKFWVDMDGNLFAKDMTTHNLKIVDGNLGPKIIFDHEDGITINGNNGEQIRLNANEGMAIDVQGDKRIWIGNDGLMYAKKLYIMGEDADEILEDIDGSYISDLTVNSLKTLGYENTRQDIIHIAQNFFRFNTWYTDSEKTKLEFTFEGTGDDSYPVMILGAGNGNPYEHSSERAKIYKDSHKFAIEYDAPNGKMSRFYFNETDTDDEGQAVYFESKGGVRFHSDNKFVAKTALDRYMRVVNDEGIKLLYGDKTLELKPEHIMLRFDDENYIKIDSTGIKLVGVRIDIN